MTSTRKIDIGGVVFVVCVFLAGCLHIWTAYYRATRPPVIIVIDSRRL